MVLIVKAAAAIIVDDTDGGNGGVAVVSGVFENAFARAGANGAGMSGVGTTTIGGGSYYAYPVGAILSMTTTATRYTRCDVFNTATTAAAKER